MNGQKINIGEKYGTFTVIAHEKDKKNKTIYILKCQCGAERKRVGFFVRKAAKCRFCRTSSLIGKKNAKTTFVKYIKNDKFECLCDCGKKFIGEPRSKSCGCHKEERIVEEAKKIIGFSDKGLKILSFERLEYTTNKKCRISIFKAKCFCGKIFEVKRSILYRLKSCGCLKHKNGQKLDNHYKTKLSKNDVLSIIEMYLTGLYSKNEICRIMNAHISVVRSILNRKSWKSLDIPKKIIKNSPMKKNFGKTRKIEPILIGKKYNNWTVIEKSNSQGKRAFYLCECQCKRQYQVSATSLRLNKTSKCVKCQQDLNKKYDYKSFVGKKILSKKIIEYIYENKTHKFKTICDCGHKSMNGCNYIIHNKKNHCEKCYPRKPRKSN